MSLNAAKLVKKRMRTRVQFGSISYQDSIIWKNEENSVFLRN